jgi:hypothetical protein
MLSGNITSLRFIMEWLHVGFFTLAVIGCPIGFLVGAIGGIVQFRKESKKK